MLVNGMEAYEVAMMERGQEYTSIGYNLPLYCTEQRFVRKKGPWHSVRIDVPAH